MVRNYSMVTNIKVTVKKLTAELLIPFLVLTLFVNTGTLQLNSCLYIATEHWHYNKIAFHSK